MYKGNCECQAVNFELSDSVKVSPPVPPMALPEESISEHVHDEYTLMLEADKQHVIIDSAPSTVNTLHTASGETHHVCNQCGTLLFVEKSPNVLHLKVKFLGHNQCPTW